MILDFLAVLLPLLLPLLAVAALSLSELWL